MFTADPISGNRKVTSIDASFGLGEACYRNVFSSNGSRIGAIKRGMQVEMPPALLRVAPNWASGEMVSELVRKLLKKWLGDADPMHRLERSLPGNVTSELGLMIGDLADFARQNTQLIRFLESADDEGFYKELEKITCSEQF